MNSPDAPRLPLRLLVGFSARSASDDLAQALAPALAEALERPVKVELMPGAAGAKAALATVASPPDGTALMVATFGTHVIGPTVSPRLGYDPLVDFTPVMLATRSPLILAVHPALPAWTVADLVALAGCRTLTYGSSSTSSAPYLAAALLQKLAGVTMEHVGYADTRVLYQDLVDGRLDLSTNNPMTMLPLLRSGQLRGLAVTTATRTAATPELPSLAEAGLKHYAVSNWLGFAAPPHTPAAVVSEQNAALGTALRSPKMVALLDESGIELVVSTPDAFTRHIIEEQRRWAWIQHRDHS